MVATNKDFDYTFQNMMMILVVVFIEIKLRTMFTLNIFGKHGGRVTTSLIEPDISLVL